MSGWRIPLRHLPQARLVPSQGIRTHKLPERTIDPS
jgi:hypothetical protein